MAINQILSLPAAAAGLAPASSASAWGYGSWVEATASSAGIYVTGLSFCVETSPAAADATYEQLFEIGIGTAGAEVTKLQVPHSYRADTITTANNGLGYWMPFNIYFPEPYFIPLGSRIAVRATDSIASAITYGGVKILYQEGTAPTVALNTPSDASSGSTTPQLNFTGTDAESDAVEYEVQIDTANTFDSASTPNTLIKSFTEINYINRYRMPTDCTEMGEAFQATACTLTSCKFYLYWEVAALTGSAIANIYTGAGTFGTDMTPTGSALATSDPFDVSALTDTIALHTFNFSGANQIALTQDAYYVITIAYSGAASLVVGIETTGVLNPGNLSRLSGTWAARSYDQIYYVYGTTGGGPLIDALSATGSGFTAGHPFASATAIDYTASTLASGTYYWRVRAIDPLGTNTYGAWSSTRSFVIAGATLTATVQNYVLTGQSANFKRAISLTATAQSYVLTGISATLRYGHLIGATVQSYALTTVPANFKKALKLTATAQSYTLTGVAVNLKHGYTLTATVRSYAVTGVASNLKRGYTLTATVRSYALTGIANNYLRGRVMPATAQSYALTGIAANLVRNTTLTATVRSYALTGVAINVKRNYTLTATARSYALTGTATGLLRGRRLTATQQNYALSGSATSLSVNYRLTATVQTYAIIGTANALKRGYTLTATVRSYTITGVDINVKRNYTLAATVRSFTLAFINANLVTERNYRLTATVRNIAITGSGTGLTRSYTLTATARSYAISGGGITGGYHLTATERAIQLTAGEVNLTLQHRISGESQGYVINGAEITVIRNYTLLASGGTASLTFINANLYGLSQINYSLGASPAEYRVAGSVVVFLLSTGYPMMQRIGAIWVAAGLQFYDGTAFSTGLVKVFTDGEWKQTS